MVSEPVHHKRIAWKSKTKSMMKRKHKASGIDCLPQDLIIDIVVRVAATSSSPIFNLENLGSTCKRFREASKEKNVRKHLAIEKEEGLRWRNKERYFMILKSCAAAGNSEACFLVGLEYIFNQDKIEEGLFCLHEAMDDGHDTAKYVLGILSFYNHESRELGMQLLNNLNGGCKSFMNQRIYQCRKEAHQVIRAVTWKRSLKHGQGGSIIKPICHKVKCSWEGLEEFFCSQFCMWSHECIKFFEDL